MVDWGDWINLGLRWFHFVAGIAWIGSSFYFVWLDNHLKPPKDGGASGEVWSVHGGGFYHNQKYQVAPAQMPGDLHWFKWEAYFTWLSGFSLLVLIYYIGADVFLIDPQKARLSQSDAIAVGLASLLIGWAIYDALCRSPLRRDNRVLGSVWFGMLVLAAIALDALFSARGAYLHVGAIIGTVMVGNVFFVIIPNQRKVVADLVAGREPDPALGQAAKMRSVHNNYMTLPVLFIMISHHYPMTYGAERPWLVLALLGATGIAVRHVFNLRHRDGDTRVTVAVAAGLALASVTYVSFEPVTVAPGAASGPVIATDALATVTYAQVAPVFAKHCISCHQPTPTNAAFSAPPLGVVLHTFESASAAAPRIKKVAVDARTMPMVNDAEMTQADRNLIGAWIAQGTP